MRAPRTGRFRSGASSSSGTATISARCRSGGSRRAGIPGCSPFRYLLEYPFADRLYPRALEVLARLRDLGSTVVLTDGDAVFQPRKAVQAGIGDVVDAVLVYVHKEEELDDVERRFPAERYVLVDDKVRILAAAKLHWGERVTTVLPKQGQFANDPEIAAAHPPPTSRSMRSATSSTASTCRRRAVLGCGRVVSCQSSTQRRKPPRNASSLWPRRQLSGRSPTLRALPPPRTT